MNYDFEQDMTGKRCLVTGATSGHGEAVARVLARNGAELTVHGRNPEKLKRVCDGIESETGKRPETLVVNFSSLSDVRRGAEEFCSRDQALDLLVNNAGMVNQGRKVTEDGFEEVFAVNYLAMYVFTLMVLEPLKRAVPSRIVNVASDAHYIASLDLEDLDQKDNYSLMGAYGRSKLAIVYFTRELARRLEGTGVTVNAVDPGPVASGIAKKGSFIAGLADGIIQLTFPKPEKAARSCLYLCMSPDVEGKSGEYFRFMKFKDPKIDFDPEYARKVWEKTADMTGVDLKVGSPEAVLSGR
jgi:NAD(P)-dependent dehydrogenase (short-subunit alcohol dehydrogenase family)